MESQTPLLITLDVHDHPHLNTVVMESADFFSKAGERVTYFVPATLVAQHREFRHTLRRLRATGHSIGCHGLSHTDAEDLGSLSAPAEFALLKEATDTLTDALGSAITSFRAPAFRIGRRTLSFLAELGYQADCSVTPQRLCLLSSSPWSFGWLGAPRAPYRPRAGHPFRRGNLSLLEIPTSTWVFPLGHGTIANLPEWVSRVLVAGLAEEAQYLPRVVVPMFHPEAVVGAGEPWRPSFRWRDLVPCRFGGVRARFYFFLELDAETIHRRTMASIRQLRGLKGLVSLSVDDYLATGTVRPMELDVELA
jgi:peptidoglycan/xylan/chitin deacetylase (PgdA/CDA1 family)